MVDVENAEVDGGRDEVYDDSMVEAVLLRNSPLCTRLWMLPYLAVGVAEAGELILLSSLFGTEPARDGIG